jgi:hypothetical protein
VPANQRSHIFDKFGQVASAPGDRRSTGLGLTFCLLAVQAHGGTIGVEDREGGGSTFWVEIGVPEAPAIKVSEPPLGRADEPAWGPTIGGGPAPRRIRDTDRTSKKGGA